MNFPIVLAYINYRKKGCAIFDTPPFIYYRRKSCDIFGILSSQIQRRYGFKFIDFYIKGFLLYSLVFLKCSPFFAVFVDAYRWGY